MKLLAGSLLGVALIALLFFQLTRNAKETTAPDDVGVAKEPDLYGKDVRFQQLREDGSPHYYLEASVIRQYEADALTRMTEPKLRLFNAAQPPWDIESKHGYIRRRPGPGGAEEDVVYLREQVQLVQQHPQRGLVTMRGEAFYIYPDRQYAETDQSVMIDTQVGRTKAGGLRVDMESGLLSLSSSSTQRVHTIVLPEQFKKN